MPTPTPAARYRHSPVIAAANSGLITASGEATITMLRALPRTSVAGSTPESNSWVNAGPSVPKLLPAMKSTAICTAYTSEQYQEAVAEGQTWLGGFAELRDVTWIDMATSHWPMWSRPEELAEIIGSIATGPPTAERA